MIDNGRCDKRCIWNPSNCECECGKLCDIGEYLDYKNCKYRKRLFDKPVQERSGNINWNKMIYNSTLNDYGKIYNSCTIHIVLLVMFFIISIGASCGFVYSYWYLKKDNTNIGNINANTETVIYWKYKW